MMDTTRISRSAKLAGATAAVLGLTFGGAATAVWAQSDTAPATSDRPAKAMIVQPHSEGVSTPQGLTAFAFDSEGDDAAWAPFEACVEAAIGAEPTDAEFEAMTDAEFEALDATFEAVEAECLPLLPEAEQAELAKWTDFEDCMDTNLGDKAGGEDGDMVFIETDEGEEVVVLNGEGTVTVTRDAAGAVTVETTGAVESFDETAIDAAFDAAETACGDLLPEGWDDFEDGDWEMGDWDDHEVLEFDEDDVVGANSNS